MGGTLSSQQTNSQEKIEDNFENFDSDSQQEDQQKNGLSGTSLRVFDRVFPDSKKYVDKYRLYKARIPYLVEDYLGLNRHYTIATCVPNNLLTHRERKAIKEGDTDEVKKMYFKGLLYIDDPMDPYAKHTMLHDAVVMNREDLFEFLINQKANLMVRDANGYTPMLKAAALGRIDMVKVMIEEGVDPRHIDPYGNTPKDKAKLYNKYEMITYLDDMEKKANRGELKIVNWNDSSRIRRSGKFMTYFDY